MKTLITAIALALGLCAEAYDGLYLPVYSYTKSDAELHIREFPEPGRQWNFPASYTGHRSVCWLPGASSNTAFVAWVGGDEWQPGDPFGFTPAASPSNTQAIALTRVSAVTPRLKLWTEATSDRALLFNESSPSFRHEDVNPVDMPRVARLRIVRARINDAAIWNLQTLPKVCMDMVFDQDIRDFIHEGDLFVPGEFDIDWDALEADVTDNESVEDAYGSAGVTNMAYAVVVGDGDISYLSDSETTHTVYAHPYMIQRRFEETHTPPTAASCTTNSALAMFAWRIDGEDRWASAFGTTYTAFRVRVYDSGSNVLHDTGYRRMPPIGAAGSYRWTAPSEWLEDISSWATWRVFTYNAKFKTDDVGSAAATFTP